MYVTGRTVVGGHSRQPDELYKKLKGWRMIATVCSHPPQSVSGFNSQYPFLESAYMPCVSTSGTPSNPYSITVTYI